MQSQPAAARGAASAATDVAAQPVEAGAADASDAHKGSSNAASTATGKANTRGTGKNPPTKSKSQEIPKGRTTANQRMTRAAAARAAAELADTAPGSVMEEEDEMDEDMAEDPGPDYDLVNPKEHALPCLWYHRGSNDAVTATPADTQTQC